MDEFREVAQAFLPWASDVEYGESHLPGIDHIGTARIGIESDAFWTEQCPWSDAVPSEARNLYGLVAGDIPNHNCGSGGLKHYQSRARRRYSSAEVRGHALLLRLLKDSTLFGFRAKDLNAVLE